MKHKGMINRLCIANRLKALIYGLMVLFIFQSILIGCTEGDVVIRRGEGYVVIRPDCSEYTLPSLKYYFYCTDEDREPIIATCDGAGNYAGLIPTGDYYVLAVNPEVDNVVYSGMDSYETARATVQPASAHARTGVDLLTYPGDLYAVRLAKLTTGHKDTIVLEPQPALLTKRVQLSVILKDGLANEVQAVSGKIRGVLPAVQLSTGKAMDETGSTETTKAVDFVFSTSDEGWETSLSLLGVRDPEHGNAYENKLSLYLTDERGVRHVETDISNGLSEILNNGQGDLPLVLTSQIEVSRSGIELTAVIVDWEESGSGESNIEH